VPGLGVRLCTLEERITAISEELAAAKHERDMQWLASELARLIQQRSMLTRKQVRLTRKNDQNVSPKQGPYRY
jgi:predicted  nucleic acid-binding Zn-ribbon protein